MNENIIGNIKISPYNFIVYDEGILFKASYGDSSIYARHLKELEEKCIEFVEEKENESM